MKPILACVTVATMATMAMAQTREHPSYRVLTYPRVPQRETLDRLNLEVAWVGRIKLESGRDSLSHLQILPQQDSEPVQVGIQTAAGVLVMFDGDNGDVQWRVQVGDPYWSTQPVGYNPFSIYAARRDYLYILERNSGRHRVYTFNSATREKVFGYKLDFVPSAGLAADDERLYVPMGNRILTYQIPQYELLAKRGSRKPEDIESFGALQGSPQPELVWSALEPGVQYDQAPLVSLGQISLVSLDGRLLSFNKYERILRYEFQTKGNISVAAAQHKNVAYLGSHDSVLYALDMNNEKILWRFLVGQRILSPPYATDNDIFVAARGGLTRLERATGKPYWSNPQAERFLAVNGKYVYALDRVGNMLVLDGWRGGTLAKLDVRDWTLSIPNEWTDRIYLSAQDGQIMCLRCRDYPSPLRVKTISAPKKKLDDPKMEEEKKEPEKKDEKMGCAPMPRDRSGFAWETRNEFPRRLPNRRRDGTILLASSPHRNREARTTA